MKIALVHDYLNEYGGAERVLEALAEMYPEAPIYTAFYQKNSSAYERLKHRDIHVSFAHYIPWFARKLHSPLRFLAPAIWQSFDFSGFDVVISSSSWFLTKGIKVPKSTLHVSYVHTPPRNLYGYQTGYWHQKHWLVRVYAAIVNKELRQFDYESAQRVDVLVANSKEVQSRIWKFWRKESVVIYPPVNILHNSLGILPVSLNKGDALERYYLTGGRLVAPKHFDLAIQAANELKIPLKIFGAGPEEGKLRGLAGPTVTFLGKVSETQLHDLYGHAQAFIALATDEDFGITPVEAMMMGTPVVAYRGGGYLETVVEGKTGVFFDELTVEGVKEGMKKFEDRSWKIEEIREYAQRFSKERFVKEMGELVQRELEKKA